MGQHKCCCSFTPNAWECTRDIFPGPILHFQHYKSSYWEGTLKRSLIPHSFAYLSLNARFPEPLFPSHFCLRGNLGNEITTVVHWCRWQSSIKDHSSLPGELYAFLLPPIYCCLQLLIWILFSLLSSTLYSLCSNKALPTVFHPVQVFG